MRRVVAVLILIGLGVLLYYNPSVYKRDRDIELEKLFDANIEEDEILPLAKADDGALSLSLEKLQQTPDQVITFNTMLLKVMYQSGEGQRDALSEEEIQLLAKVQRKYYHEDLLARNPESRHLSSVVDEVLVAQEEGSWIVGYVVEAPAYSPEDVNQAVVQVTIIPNSLGESTDLYQQYLLERVDGLWYIKGWRGLTPAEAIFVE